MKTKEEINNMTNEELGSYKDELNSKFAQLRKLAHKVAHEMDSIVDQYNMIKATEYNRTKE